MPPLSRDNAQQFLSEHHRGVLVTLKASDGRPQLSNVLYAMMDGEIVISVTDSRAKTANARRDPRVSLYVTSDDFWTYLVAEGNARLSPVAAEPGDATCQRLLAYFEAAQEKPHPDPDEYFEAMVADRRLTLSFTPDRIYPTA